MARSSWKPPFVDNHLLKKVRSAVDAGKLSAVINTWSRRSVIIPDFVGLTFGVYNGKKFIPVRVSEDMINRKLGEFSPTRTFRGHSADKKAKRG